MKKRRGSAVWLLGWLGISSWVFAAGSNATSVRILSLASRDYLTQQVGKYDPSHSQPWIFSDTYLERPLQGTVYSLFGVNGKLAEVHTLDLQRMDSDGLAWAWYAHISQWPWQLQEQSLAIQGSWPSPTRVAESLPVDDPASLQIVSNFLKTRRLEVPHPFITQAYQVDLLGDGQKEKLLCAHSDASALTDTTAAMIYAVVLVAFERDGHPVTLPVVAYTAYKPAARSLENQEKYYGRRPFYRLIAFPEITGDGHLEIVYTRNLEFLPATLVDTFDGKTVKKVLESYILE